MTRFETIVARAGILLLAVAVIPVAAWLSGGGYVRWAMLCLVASLGCFVAAWLCVSKLESPAHSAGRFHPGSSAAARSNLVVRPRVPKWPSAVKPGATRSSGRVGVSSAASVGPTATRSAPDAGSWGRGAPRASLTAPGLGRVSTRSVPTGGSSGPTAWSAPADTAPAWLTDAEPDELLPPLRPRFMADGTDGNGPVFPIADYDELWAAEILPLLPELDDDELELVAQYEEAGARRSSIVNRVEALLGRGVGNQGGGRGTPAVDRSGLDGAAGT